MLSSLRCCNLKTHYTTYFPLFYEFIVICQTFMLASFIMNVTKLFLTMPEWLSAEHREINVTFIALLNYLFDMNSLNFKSLLPQFMQFERDQSVNCRLSQKILNIFPFYDVPLHFSLKPITLLLILSNSIEKFPKFR